MAAASTGHEENYYSIILLFNYYFSSKLQAAESFISSRCCFFAWKEHAATQRNVAAVWQIYPLISDCVTATHHHITGFLQTAERDSWLTPALWLTCFTAATFKMAHLMVWRLLILFFLPSLQEQEERSVAWQPANVQILFDWTESYRLHCVHKKWLKKNKILNFLKIMRVKKTLRRHTERDCSSAWLSAHLHKTETL